MLATRVSLHDIEDVWAFVNERLNDEFREIDMGEDERAELVAEGLAILYQLAGRFDPRRAGHTQAGRFSGFAAFYLPKKLKTAWHRMHPEHVYVTLEGGKRSWLYLRRAESLDAAQTGRDGGSREVRALPPVKWVAPEPAAA